MRQALKISISQVCQKFRVPGVDMLLVRPEVSDGTSLNSWEEKHRRRQEKRFSSRLGTRTGELPCTFHRNIHVSKSYSKLSANVLATVTVFMIWFPSACIYSHAKVRVSRAVTAACTACLDPNLLILHIQSPPLSQSSSSRDCDNCDKIQPAFYEKLT